MRRTNSPTIGGTYRYDALNRLASRTVTQSAAPTTFTTLYVHDLEDHIIAETDTSGQTLREYIWLGDIPLAVVDKVATGSPIIYYVHSDHLGRPARMTAQNQAWVWDVIYSPTTAAKDRTKLSLKGASMYPYIDWEKEPDLDSLRLAYSQLAENPEKSLGVLQELASRGSVASMWYLGDAFASGAHLQKDVAQAQFWFAKADEAGWIPAPYMRGRVAFASGDHKKAFDDFSRGASKAHTPAVYRLAMMYKDGRGTNKNITAARNLLELAARHGHLFAKRDLASLYISGAFGKNKAIVGFLMLFRLAFDIVCIAISGRWRRVGFEDRIMA